MVATKERRPTYTRRSHFKMWDSINGQAQPKFHPALTDRGAKPSLPGCSDVSRNPSNSKGYSMGFLDDGWMIRSDEARKQSLHKAVYDITDKTN